MIVTDFLSYQLSVFSFRLLLADFSNPDVAKFDGVAMELEADRSFFWVGCGVLRYSFVGGGAFEFLGIVDDDAVVHDCDDGGFD